MKIVKEQTRLVFTEYTPDEESKLDDIVGTMNDVFAYKDPDKKMIAFPPGMEDVVRQVFPYAVIQDNHLQSWEYDEIQSVTHNAAPRNQLQIDFINFLMENYDKHIPLAGILSPGTGKALRMSEPIPTPDGFKLMKDIQVGDYVYDKDGIPTKVIGVYPQGEIETYKITFNDHRTAICCDDHLWLVKSYHYGKYHPVPLNKIKMDYMRYDRYRNSDGAHRKPFKYKYQVPKLSFPLTYKHIPLDIHPYVMGVFAASYYYKSSILHLNMTDDYIPNKVAKLTGLEYRVVRNKKYNTYYFYKKGNPYKPIFTENFFGKYFSYSGIIHKDFIFNDIPNRTSLIQGLMDVAGHINENKHRYRMHFYNHHKGLMMQVRTLFRSYGYDGVVYADCNRIEKSKHWYGTLNLRIPNSMKKIFFTEPQKLSIAINAEIYGTKDNFSDHILITNVEKYRLEECKCIEVDSPSKTYLTGQFIPTHNTFMACYSAIKVGYKTLIIVPTSSIRQQWADTLVKMFNVDPSRIATITSPTDMINANADFIIVSHASLISINKKYDLEKILKQKKLGIKVIDEVQMWFKNIVNVDGCSNVKCNWYLTGTFGRSAEDENRLYHHMFGTLKMFREQDKKATLFNRRPGNIYGMKPHVHTTMIWTHSGLSKEQIRSVSNNVQYSERAGKWMRYGISVPAYTSLIIPEDGTITPYLKVVIKVLKQADHQVKYGKTLILTSTIKSCDVLYKIVTDLFPKQTVGIINSSHTRLENEQIKNASDILISTVKSAGTGFDVKDLSKLIVLQPFKSEILSIQVMGRLRRRPDGRDTYMWDIVDADISQLAAWAANRADAIKPQSKEFKVVDM